MEASQMFEQASRMKLRFGTPRGPVSTEDLWDLPLTSTTGRVNLDAIGMKLFREIRDSDGMVSLVEPGTQPNAELLLAFEIVKHVIAVRVRERDELKAASDRREKKNRILELIARKQDEELGQKSVDELRQLAESL